MSAKALAQEVLDLIKVGRYQAPDGSTIRIGREVEYSVENTILYTPEKLEALRVSSADQSAPEIKVVNGTTQAVAQKMAAESNSKLALLNFASARNPGGGFLTGAKAQEEDLCRCSTLYPTLRNQFAYYEANRKQDSMLYTDHMIYSPSVTFFKVSGSRPYLPEPFVVDVITAPAPNSRPYLKRNKKLARLEACFLRRWENVLFAAAEQGVRRLLLGAWGCGAFGGDPEMASQTAKEAINAYGGPFDQIVFAIPDRGKRSSANFKVFQRVFG